MRGRCRAGVGAEAEAEAEAEGGWPHHAAADAHEVELVELAAHAHALTMQQPMPMRWNLLSLRRRKTAAKSAANSISAPRIIWYTLAVTYSRPTFMRMVATRSNAVGMDSSRHCTSSLCGGGGAACEGRWGGCVGGR